MLGQHRRTRTSVLHLSAAKRSRRSSRPTLHRFIAGRPSLALGLQRGVDPAGERVVLLAEPLPLLTDEGPLGEVNRSGGSAAAAVEAGDPDAAADEMARHLQTLRPVYERVWLHRQ